MTRRATLALACLGLVAVSGCSPDVDVTYGRSRGPSLNGTHVLADALRKEGHTVRAAVRLGEDLSDWARVIVRFAQHPGPPAKDESDWYLQWLDRGEGRRMIYVPRDYDARFDYWSAALAALPPDADPDVRSRIEGRRDRAEGATGPRLMLKAESAAAPTDWFAVEEAKGPPAPAKNLEGPWAVGVDPKDAAVSRHDGLKADNGEDVLLRGDGVPLAISWERYSGGEVLVVANGSFLLNGALLKPGRRPLAERFVMWAGDDGPANVAFVEGGTVLGDPESRSVLSILNVHPFGWVAAQMLALGLAACLARAPRLGRPRPSPPGGVDRPAAHPEALGDLMARTREADAAREILRTYRRWRSPSRADAGIHHGGAEDAEKSRKTV